MVATRPTIAISRCLLGEAVRYDGRSKPVPELIEVISRVYEIIPVCPEVEAGLSIPRPPVELVQLEDKRIITRGRDDHTIDATLSLKRQADHFIQQHAQMDAALLQNRSPSCGVGDAPLFTNRGREIMLRDGLFCAALRSAYPAILITTPAALQQPTTLQQLLEAAKNKYKKR